MEPMPLAPLGHWNWSDAHKFWPEWDMPNPLQMRRRFWILTHVLNTVAPLMSKSHVHMGGGEGGGEGAGGVGGGGLGDGGGDGGKGDGGGRLGGGGGLGTRKNKHEGSVAETAESAHKIWADVVMPEDPVNWSSVLLL